MQYIVCMYMYDYRGTAVLYILLYAKCVYVLYIVIKGVYVV